MTSVLAPPSATSRRRADPSPLRHVDWSILGIPVVLSLAGLLMVYSSTRTRLAEQGLSETYYVSRQALAVVIGIGAMAVATLVDYRRIRDWAALLYVAMLPLLAGVILLGATRAGAQAWFQVGPLQFQPSEPAKIVLVLALAAYCHQYRGDLDAWRLGVACAIAALPIGLVLVQPDIGTAMVLAVVAVAVLLVAGIRGRHLVVLFLVAGTALGTAISTGTLEDYQVDRLTGFLAQESTALTDQSRSSWNTNQSKIAIGNGGLTGQGLFEGTQTKYSYVPEQHTDFIFTVVGEELGFVGGAAILALLGVLVWRMWRAAVLAADFFGTLVCIGVLAIFAFQAFENVGMAMGIMPVTGLPLPFLSYGGSAVIAMFVGAGLVANVHMRRFA